MTRFSDIEASMLSPVIDDMFGETTRIVPQLRSELTRRGADPDRPAYDAWGVIDEVVKIIRAKDAGRRDGDSSDLSASRTDISYTTSELGDRVRWPKPGDRIEVSGPFRSYLVAAEPQEDGNGRVIVKVQRAK